MCTQKLTNSQEKQTAMKKLKTNKSSAVAEMGDRLAIIYMGRKVGPDVSLSVGGAGSPSNTMWPGPSPISVPRSILIHVAVWPQYTVSSDRTDRTGLTGLWFDGIGRTVLQTVAGKPRISEERVIKSLESVLKPEKSHGGKDL